MKKVIMVFVLLVVALSACGTAAPVAETTEAAGGSAATPTQPSLGPSFTPTPLPSSTPTAAATPLPARAVIGPDNFQDASIVQVYLDRIDGLVTSQYHTEPGNWRISMWTYSPDGRSLAVGGCTDLSTANCYSDMVAGHAFLYIIDAETAELIYSLPEEEIEVTGLSFSPDGKWLAYAVCPQRLMLLNLDSLQTERTLWSDRGCGSNPKIAISPDGTQVALVVGTRLLVFDLATGQQLTEQLAQRHGSVLPKYNRDGTRLAVFAAPDGQEIAIYDTSTWQRTARFRVSNGQVAPQAVDFSADGRWVATVDTSQDADIQLWNAATGEQIAVLEEPLEWLNTVAFSPDGSLLLAGGSPSDLSDTGYIAAWDPASLTRLGTIQGQEPPGRIMFAADGGSFMASEYLVVERWSLPDEAMLAARHAVVSFLEALAAGDYETAAQWYQPLEEERGALLAAGFDPTDMPGTLEAICAQPHQPCMPLDQILYSGKAFSNEYLFKVSFTAPDGSLYQGVDGETSFGIYVDILPDGSMKVSYLPNFFYSTGQ